MIKKTVIATVLLLLMVVLFSSCGSFSFNSAENLIRPPKLSGDDGALQAAFESALKDKGEYILKYPSDGDYRSAFVKFDCDGDGSDEAFVFYSLKAEAMNIYMYILDYKDGEWTPVGEIQGDGNDVHSIEFSDLNNDGQSEILVGWSSLDLKTNKKLSVYASTATENDSVDYRAAAIETFTDKYTVDLDGDGETEIFLVLINSTSDSYTTEARLLKMTTENNDSYKMTSVGQVSLYSEMTAVTGLISGISGGRRYIYIDEAAGDTYLTELVYWDSKNNTLVLPLRVDMISVSSSPTSRSVPLNCMDIDNDGEIEIPSTVLLHESSVVMKTAVNGRNAAVTSESVVAEQENVYVINWNKFNNDIFTVVCSYIHNQYDGFKIKYDDEKMADWQVMLYPDSHLSQFFIIDRNDDPETENATELLFSITAVEPTETVSIGAYLLTGDNYKYTYEITDKGRELGITKNYIISILDLL